MRAYGRLVLSTFTTFMPSSQNIDLVISVMSLNYVVPQSSSRHIQKLNIGPKVTDKRTVNESKDVSFVSPIIGLTNKRTVNESKYVTFVSPIIGRPNFWSHTISILVFNMDIYGSKDIWRD